MVGFRRRERHRRRLREVTRRHKTSRGVQRRSRRQNDVRFRVRGGRFRQRARQAVAHEAGAHRDRCFRGRRQIALRAGQLVLAAGRHRQIVWGGHHGAGERAGHVLGRSERERRVGAVIDRIGRAGKGRNQLFHGHFGRQRLGRVAVALHLQRRRRAYRHLMASFGRLLVGRGHVVRQHGAAVGVRPHVRVGQRDLDRRRTERRWRHLVDAHVRDLDRHAVELVALAHEQIFAGGGSVQRRAAGRNVSGRNVVRVGRRSRQLAVRDAACLPAQLARGVAVQLRGLGVELARGRDVDAHRGFVRDVLVRAFDGELAVLLRCRYERGRACRRGAEHGAAGGVEGRLDVEGAGLGDRVRGPRERDVAAGRDRRAVCRERHLEFIVRRARVLVRAGVLVWDDLVAAVAVRGAGLFTGAVGVCGAFQHTDVLAAHLVRGAVTIDGTVLSEGRAGRAAGERDDEEREAGNAQHGITPGKNMW